MPTFTLDKDNLESAALAVTTSPMQVTPTRTSSWTHGKTTLILLEEDPDNLGTYLETPVAITDKMLKLIDVKAKNYKIKLHNYSDSDSVTLIVTG